MHQTIRWGLGLGAGLLLALGASADTTIQGPIKFASPDFEVHGNRVNSGPLVGSGTVTSITAGEGLSATPNPIITSGTIDCNVMAAGTPGCGEPDGTSITAAGGVLSTVNSGTVISVGATAPSGVLGITGSPITSTGTFVFGWSGTSGGIPYFSGASTLASSAALTADRPVIGGGAGASPTVGTRSGNTTEFATSTGSKTSGYVAKWDASGNLIQGGGPPVSACADLSDDGTACTANTGTSGGTLPFLNGTNTWSGTQTFGTVQGGVNTQSGTTYTFVAGDCGKLVVFTSATAVTATIPASIVPGSTTCAFAVLQAGAGKVSVNGTAVAAATLVSPDSFVATSGDAGSMIGLTLVTVSAATNAYLSGRGS